LRNAGAQPIENLRTAKVIEKLLRVPSGGSVRGFRFRLAGRVRQLVVDRFQSQR
jgi:hypothetical protein